MSYIFGGQNFHLARTKVHVWQKKCNLEKSSENVRFFLTGKGCFYENYKHIMVKAIQG